MIGIVTASHYLQPVGDGELLPPLEPMLTRLCREPPRRVDRFIKLALLGSASCAAGQALRPDCGIYLGSGIGPMGSNIATQEQLIRAREIPRPFDFINTLGGSAGYYIARNLGCRGQNFFISRRGASLQALLDAVLADMELGLVTQALVGSVEEVTLPLAAHRQRQGLAAGTPVAEGSHWLLLQTQAHGKRALHCTRCAEFAELESCLQCAWQPGDRLCCTRDLQPGTRAKLQEQFPTAPPVSDTAFHDSVEAAWVTEFLTGRDSGSLYLVSGTQPRGWRLFHFRA